MSITHFNLQSSSNCHYYLVKCMGEVFIFLILQMQKLRFGGGQVICCTLL